jgi:hypothetical protein
MTLPHPARQAWLQHRQALARIAVRETPSGRLLLGGGTVLAARWGHRLSVDIDVLVPDRQGVQDAHPGGPCDLARATGGRAVGKWRDRIKVRVGEALLDVAAMSPELPGLEAREQVEGRNEIVLSTAQILRGKLNRTHQGLARDAFDLITAAKADPQALQAAVNALDTAETEIVSRNLRSANDQMANDAPDALRGIGDEFRTDLGRLGEHSASAVEDSRYTRVRITLEAGQLIIERQTRSGVQHPAQYAIRDVADALRRSGIGEYLTANHATHTGIAALGIAELHRQGRQGSVLDTAREEPTAEIEGAAAAAFEQEEQQLHRKTLQPGDNPRFAADDARPRSPGTAAGNLTSTSRDDDTYTR